MKTTRNDCGTSDGGAARFRGCNTDALDGGVCEGARDAAGCAAGDAAAGGRIGADAQPCREENIEAFLSYWRSGAKPEATRVGIELEHTLVHAADDSAVSYYEERGVRWVLEQLSATFPNRTYGENGELIGVARRNGSVLEAVTLEPAAQLELSAGPFARIEDARACFEAFELLLARIAHRAGLRIVLAGYHPTARALDLPLIPKQRYEFMDRYFAKIGPWGARMMRATASTQVSVDYTGEDDVLRKLRLAFAAAPVLALIGANAPIFEGAAAPWHTVRMRIWRGCDPARCGLVPGVLDSGFSLRRYAEFLLDMPAVLVPAGADAGAVGAVGAGAGAGGTAGAGAGGWRYTEDTFGSIYAAVPMERAHVEHAISMSFTDVRLKTYLEIRPADALPVERAMDYAALVRALFASERALAAMEGLFARVDADAFEAAKRAIETDGWDARVYGRPVRALADTLRELQ